MYELSRVVDLYLDAWGVVERSKDHLGGGGFRKE